MSKTPKSLSDHLDPQYESRFLFIEFLLVFKGRFSRAELVERFNIGEATASRTIAAFTECYPGHIDYLGPRNGYRIRQSFVPNWEHDAVTGLRYLASGEIVEKFDVECFGPLRLQLQHQLDFKKVASITRALVNQCLVNIGYVSSSSGRKPRSVAPHSVFEAGGTWYFRAFDTASYEFRTFKFSRVVTAIELDRVADSTEVGLKDDAWHRMRRVRLFPHPKNPMPDAQRLDLGLQDHAIKEWYVSEACLGFVLTDLRVDCSRHYKLSCYEYPLALNNRDELESVESMIFAPGFS